MKNYQTYSQTLTDLTEAGQLRQFRLPPTAATNFSTNDYLGLGFDETLQQDFYESLKSIQPDEKRFGSTSSRLLSGESEAYQQLEESLISAYNRENALVFNSGYHGNIGVIPALADHKNDLILCDKLNHASIIDGCRLSPAKMIRYRHLDLDHLDQLLAKHAESAHRIFIITESVFSMDGDLADLPKLVELKKKYGAMLIVDEAHGTGVFGERGLGLCEATNTIEDIDLILGTFGKALASVGSYLICDQIIRDYLINRMRSLIFTTALPPVNLRWSHFAFEKMLTMKAERAHLLKMADRLRAALIEKGYETRGASQIVPIIIGSNEDTLNRAQILLDAGFIAYPIRPPTVPPGTSRLRLSLSAALTDAQLDELLAALEH